MMKYLAKLILKLIGWKIEGTHPDSRKYIAISAPHTSNYDFIVGRLYYFTVSIKPYVLIKKELFFFPLNYILRALGGIPVERASVTGTYKKVIEEFEKRDEFILVITPEGTRNKTTKWKKGFYSIAKAADVPLLLSHFDYAKKVISVGEFYKITGDVNYELNKIKKYYQSVTPKHPHKFTVGNVE